jgi:hypothetical protein
MLLVGTTYDIRHASIYRASEAELCQSRQHGRMLMCESAYEVRLYVKIFSGDALAVSSRPHVATLFCESKAPSRGSCVEMTTCERVLLLATLAAL